MAIDLTTLSAHDQVAIQLQPTILAKLQSDYTDILFRPMYTIVRDQLVHYIDTQYDFNYFDACQKLFHQQCASYEVFILERQLAKYHTIVEWILGHLNTELGILLSAPTVQRTSHPKMMNDISQSLTLYLQKGMPEVPKDSWNDGFNQVLDSFATQLAVLIM